MADSNSAFGFNPKQLHVVIADDDPDALFALETLLSKEGFNVYSASNGAEAFKLAEEHLPDLVVLDFQMPVQDGPTTATLLKNHSVLRFSPVILLTSRDGVEDIVKGLSSGADDYVLKPFKKDELFARLMSAWRTRVIYKSLESSLEANEMLKKQISERFSSGRIIGKSDAMQKVYGLIDKVAKTNVPVLITGESGTGKELVAHAIHHNSLRKDKVFVVQNCAAFSESLLESELFGHVRGAFTGAVKDKAGLFEVANRGSFFLDELGEMGLPLQAKLLRVLQDGSFSPVGSTDTKKSDVRIIAATHRNLKEMIANGGFREDLYYRLNVVSIMLPALRDRRTDIPLLVESFLEAACIRNGFPKKSVTSSTLRMLMDYHWPGNVRELQNEVERLVILSGDEVVVGPEHVSTTLSQEAVQDSSNQMLFTGNLKEAISKLEERMIADALSKVDGNKSEAARLLGISRSSLISKVQSFGLDTSD